MRAVGAFGRKDSKFVKSGLSAGSSASGRSRGRFQDRAKVPSRNSKVEQVRIGQNGAFAGLNDV